MKKLFLFTAIIASACQGAQDEVDVDAEALPDKAPAQTASEMIALDDRVTLRIGDLASEPRACIVPIRVENGTSGPVNVTMLGFAVTGPGDDSQGNMFAPVAASGAVSEARVILEGQSCDAYDMIRVPEILCKQDGEDCADKINFVGSEAISISQAG